MHKQLTFEERVLLEEFLGQQRSPSEIAKALERSESTISRELSRHRVNGVYMAKLAQAEAQRRRRERPLIRKLDRPDIRDAVQDGLVARWSPEQIAGRLQQRFPKQPERHVSASSMYLWMKRQGPQRQHWEQYLRRRGRRPYHPRKPATNAARPIKNRPPVIERRGRLGDFEGDLVLGLPGSGGLLTLVDRRSRFLSLELVHNKTSRHVHQRVQQALSKLPSTKRRSITFDNGSEFVRCHLVEKSHNTRLYFADPGCPHQRGTNENTNGLIRQFFPKGLDFRTVTPQEMRRIETLMNDRPRRCLGYRTPREVFLDHISDRSCD